MPGLFKTHLTSERLRRSQRGESQENQGSLDGLFQTAVGGFSAYRGWRGELQVKERKNDF